MPCSSDVIIIIIIIIFILLRTYLKYSRYPPSDTILVLCTFFWEVLVDHDFSHFIHPLFSRITSSPPALGIPLQKGLEFRYFSSTLNVQYISIVFYLLFNSVLSDINIFSNFQVFNSCFSCFPSLKIHLCIQSFIILVPT